MSIIRLYLALLLISIHLLTNVNMERPTNCTTPPPSSNHSKRMKLEGDASSIVGEDDMFNAIAENFFSPSAITGGGLDEVNDLVHNSMFSYGGEVSNLLYPINIIYYVYRVYQYVTYL